MLRYLSNFRVHEFDPLLSDIIAQYHIMITLQRQNLKKLAKINQYLIHLQLKIPQQPNGLKKKLVIFIKNISQEKVNTLCAYLESLDRTNINVTKINETIDKMGEVVVEASKE